MAIEITIPRLGWSMEEGTLTEWLKQDGDWVNKGDMLFMLEGDKATQEVESFDEGILRLLPDGPRAGDTVKIGQVVALLVVEGETIAPGADLQQAVAPSSDRAGQSVGTGPSAHASPAVAAGPEN